MEACDEREMTDMRVAMLLMKFGIWPPFFFRFSGECYISLCLSLGSSSHPDIAEPHTCTPDPPLPKKNNLVLMLSAAPLA